MKAVLNENLPDEVMKQMSEEEIDKLFQYIMSGLVINSTIIGVSIDRADEIVEFKQKMIDKYLKDK